MPTNGRTLNTALCTAPSTKFNENPLSSLRNRHDLPFCPYTFFTLRGKCHILNGISARNCTVKEGILYNCTETSFFVTVYVITYRHYTTAVDYDKLHTFKGAYFLNIPV
jgi:hypothetical protein